MGVIKMNDLAAELAKWKIDTELHYDENGEGWVLHVIDKGVHEMTIHHGFEYGGTIYADINRLVVERVKPGKFIPGRSWIIVNARLGWVQHNKSVNHLNDFDKAAA